MKGWLSFTLVCSIGMLANGGVATWLFAADTAWALAALAGIAVDDAALLATALRDEESRAAALRYLESRGR